MTLAALIRQPWFQALLGILIFIGIIVGVYYYGKSSGRAQQQTEFDLRQSEFLKKAQESIIKANEWKDKAENAEIYAEKLKAEIGRDRQTALANESKISDAYEIQQKEIQRKYEQATDLISSDLSACERCLDLCRRSNQLTAYGPEFADAKCDAAAQCRFACDP